jgi:hypothetical protein
MLLHADDRGSVPGGGNDGIFFFAVASRPALGPTQPPIQFVPDAITSGVKRPVREADHSPPSNAEVPWNYTSTSQYVFTAWCSFKTTGTTLPLRY